MLKLVLSVLLCAVYANGHGWGAGTGVEVEDLAYSSPLVHSSYVAPVVQAHTVGVPLGGTSFQSSVRHAAPVGLGHQALVKVGSPTVTYAAATPVLKSSVVASPVVSVGHGLGYGLGYGNGYGYGHGLGLGHLGLGYGVVGVGHNLGYTSGVGHLVGNQWGAGSGYGLGHGWGVGSGYGLGHGWGVGSGYGLGHGWGVGSGYGLGHGWGLGQGLSYKSGVVKSAW